MFTTGEAVGLAKWIIDDTCLVLSTLQFRRLQEFGLWFHPFELAAFTAH